MSIETSRIKDTVLFRAMSDEEIEHALKGLRAAEKTYNKGALILSAGDLTDWMGLVLSGSVTVENNDVWGNKTILSHIGPGEFFAETYGFLAVEPLLVDAVSNEKTDILIMHISEIKGDLYSNEEWRSKLISNLLMISLQKNLNLSGRNFHISSKTIRGRVMSYLNSMYIKNKKTSFRIPFDRQQLADYLNVDRTALSKELSKMRDDGLIDFRKNEFSIRSDGLVF